MEQENSLVRNCSNTTSKPLDSLIREWLVRFCTEHEKDVAPKLPLWLEAFAGMDADTLESLFKRAFRTCRFFPKVSEILEPLRKAKETAAPEAADLEWQKVLALRRQHYNPDIPQHLALHVRGLSERTQTACRASGVFRDFETTEQLYTWAKKRFVESYLAWETLEQDQFLLPDEELKNLITEAARSKALPIPEVLEIASGETK
jgi:hypothetical protein